MSSAELRAPVELMPLKDGSFGGFSLAKRNLANVSAPLFEDAMLRHGLTVDSPSQNNWAWMEVLSHLSFEDTARVHTLVGNASSEQLDSVQAELFGLATRAVELHRNAQRMQSLEELNAFFPRVPICRIPGGSCAFKSPCLDSKLGSSDPELQLLQALSPSESKDAL